MSWGTGPEPHPLSEQLSRSIAELQAANALLQEEVERERKIDEMRKEFHLQCSHELKTPVAYSGLMPRGSG